MKSNRQGRRGVGAPSVLRAIAFMVIILGAFQGTYAANPLNTRVGAIRWDGWDSAEHGLQLERALAPAQFHYRLPFFAQPYGDGTYQINGNSDARMDEEIAHAVAGGLNFWAFTYYGESHPMNYGRKRFQASTNKRGLKYAYMIGTAPLVN